MENNNNQSSAFLPIPPPLKEDAERLKSESFKDHSRSQRPFPNALQTEEGRLCDYSTGLGPGFRSPLSYRLTEYFASINYRTPGD